MCSENSALALENSELQERVVRLTMDLSIKEASWCEQEEKLNLKVYIVDALLIRLFYSAFANLLIAAYVFSVIPCVSQLISV